MTRPWNLCVTTIGLVTVLAACARRDEASARPNDAPQQTPDSQPASPTDDEIEALVAAGLEDRVVGCAITVVEGERVRHFGYGHTSTDGGATPNERTVFGIGSVTKVFTALLLSQMASRGEVELDQSLDGLLPDGIAAPHADDVTPTLAHLASHTAGLPRLPPNLAIESMDDPYAAYDAQALYAGLTDLELETTPGQTYAYSNYGAGLLGTVLADVAGKPYGELVRARLTEPLGMHDTGIEAPADRLAAGHDAAKQPVARWTFDAIAPAGALVSTGHDMAIFVQAQLSPPAELADAIRATHEPRLEIPGGHIALGWHVDGDGVRWHNGQSAGYHAFIGFDPSHGAGAAVLCNTANGLPDGLGDALLDRLAGRPNALADRVAGS